MAKSSTKSFEQSVSTPRDLGTGISGAFLNSVFGVPQHIQNGQFVLGNIEPFVPMSREAIIHQLKLQGDRKPDRDHKIENFRRQRRAEYDALVASQIGASGEDSIFGNFGQGLRSFLGSEQLPGGDFDALMGLINNQGNPVDVSAIADANFTGLKEQFSGFGGLFGSDFQAAQGRNVLELNVQAQEAGRQRQIEALGLFQTLNPFLGATAGTSAGVEMGFLQQLGNIQSPNLVSGGADQLSTGFTKKKAKE